MKRRALWGSVAGLVLTVATAEAQTRPPTIEDTPLAKAYAAVLTNHRDEALALLKTAHPGPDDAAADMVRATLLLDGGTPAETTEARDLLTARAAMSNHAAVLAAPWDCGGRKGPRSALFDLAVLDKAPDPAAINRAAMEDDNRAALWLAETLAAHGGNRKAIGWLLSKAYKSGIVEAYYPMAVLQTQEAGDIQPVDVAANFYLFAITFAADERAIADVSGSPRKIPERVFRQIKARIETERREGYTDDAFRGLLDAAIAKTRTTLGRRPSWERRFCAVRQPSDAR